MAFRRFGIWLVPRPYRNASVNRFGSRGPGEVVAPGRGRAGRKIRRVRDNVSHFTEPILSRGRDFSEHFWERDRKRKALSTSRFEYL